MSVDGDNELVINQERNQNVTKSNFLKSYKHRVWYFLEGFSAFNIQSIPRRGNKHVDRLAVVAASYDVRRNLEDEKKKKIKVVVRPAVPDNDIDLQVFESNA